MNKTPLHFAIENDSKEMFELLILKGADINVTFLINLNMILLFLINIILNK